jgi:hypothetical protein
MRREPLSVNAAFVVHLIGNDEGSGLIGRVEHVSTGHSLRFASTAELVTFMQRAAAQGWGPPDRTTLNQSGSSYPSLSSSWFEDPDRGSTARRGDLSPRANRIR